MKIKYQNLQVKNNVKYLYKNFIYNTLHIQINKKLNLLNYI